MRAETRLNSFEKSAASEFAFDIEHAISHSHCLAAERINKKWLEIVLVVMEGDEYLRLPYGDSLEMRSVTLESVKEIRQAWAQRWERILAEREANGYEEVRR